MEATTMPSRGKDTGRDKGVQEFLRGGKAVPANVVRQHMTNVREKRKAQLERATGTQQQMAKHLNVIEKPPKPDISNPQTVKALDGLLALHKKLAGQMIPPPKIPGGLGGIFPGTISVKVVPPFDYDIIIPTVLAGNEPTLSGSSNKDTGQMSASCITATKPGFNGGSMFTEVGIYFHPVSAGTLTVHATPKFSFQRWTNSLGSSHVRSFGAGAITIFGVDVASQTIGEVGTIVATAGQVFFSWDTSEVGQVDFDFGFDLETSVSTQIEVNHTLVYLIFVQADTHVEGVGWPGSLAGAVMSVTVPFISYDFELQQVFLP
jgi:hypothetical protein